MENKKIIGIDEAGRGPLAGPVFAAAVFLFKKPDFLEEIKDSKKISEKKREKIFEKIIKSNDIVYGVASIKDDIIDKVNILEATKMAMKDATEILLQKIEEKNIEIIIDGNFLIDIDKNQKAIPKADETILECSIASIIAKVSRDRVMRDFDKTYPHYGFLKHKGYPTKEHKKAIKKYGFCPIHRKTFNFK